MVEHNRAYHDRQESKESGDKKSQQDIAFKDISTLDYGLTQVLPTKVPCLPKNLNLSMD